MSEGSSDRCSSFKCFRSLQTWQGLSSHPGPGRGLRCRCSHSYTHVRQAKSWRTGRDRGRGISFSSCSSAVVNDTNSRPGPTPGLPGQDPQSRSPAEAETPVSLAFQTTRQPGLPFHIVLPHENQTCKRSQLIKLGLEAKTRFRGVWLSVMASRRKWNPLTDWNCCVSSGDVSSISWDDKTDI